jgi:hypothetical protein
LQSCGYWPPPLITRCWRNLRRGWKTTTRRGSGPARVGAGPRRARLHRGAAPCAVGRHQGRAALPADLADPLGSRARDLPVDRGLAQSAPHPEGTRLAQPPRIRGGVSHRPRPVRARHRPGCPGPRPGQAHNA